MSDNEDENNNESPLAAFQALLQDGATLLSRSKKAARNVVTTAARRRSLGQCQVCGEPAVADTEVCRKHAGQIAQGMLNVAMNAWLGRDSGGDGGGK